MRKGMAGFFMVLCCGALLAGGCAKKEMVTGDAGIAPTAPAKPTEPPAKPVKEEPVQQQPIAEASVTREEGTITTRAEAALERIYFDFDSYVLTQTSRDILYKNAEWLMKNKTVKAQIEGHCDERGSDEYNLALGEKRAKAALNYLVTLGVSADRLSVISYGKEKPLDPGHDDAAWAKNRRAEFGVIK